MSSPGIVIDPLERARDHVGEPAAGHEVRHLGGRAPASSSGRSGACARPASESSDKPLRLGPVAAARPPRRSAASAAPPGRTAAESRASHLRPRTRPCGDAARRRTSRPRPPGSTAAAELLGRLVRDVRPAVQRPGAGEHAARDVDRVHLLWPVAPRRRPGSRHRSRSRVPAPRASRQGAISVVRQDLP